MVSSSPESPPHVRGKDSQGKMRGLNDRITPACAGKSSPGLSDMHANGDHPRMCGEKDVLLDGHLFHPGSPPHVRGKDDRQLILCVCLGITPACAGKSAISAERARRNKDHPRMCGEKHWAFHRTSLHLGSPPHVRGKGQDFVAVDSRLGITPACAGKSHSSLWITQVVKDHPRMCGEKRSKMAREEYSLGSPPHVRGKVSFLHRRFLHCRITPACAGKSY